MNIKKGIFDSFINKAFKKIDNKFYFAPAGIYWKVYILEKKEQVDDLKKFLRKFLWVVFIFVLFSIISFNSTIGFPLYIFIIFVSYIIVIIKVKKIQNKYK
jgi:hypothetical protein